MDGDRLRDHPGIERLLADWAVAVRRKDLDALLRLVAPDAEFWSHGAPALRGHAAIRETFRAFFERFDLEQGFESVELLVRGDLAVLRGVEHNHLVPADGGPPVEQTQRAVSVLARGADGRWLFARGITNLPPKPTEESGGTAPGG